MSNSNSETGHAKNLANFMTLKTSAAALGDAYNPSRESLRLEALDSLYEEARNGLLAVDTQFAAYSQAVAAREIAFRPLQKFATRMINALRADDIPPQVEDNARTLVRKLQGQRATPYLTEEEKAALAAEGKEVNEVSSSQMSFDNQLSNFGKFIQLISGLPQYAPNEPELTLAGLQSMYNDLDAKNKEVITASINLSQARIARNNILYLPSNGVVAIAADIKAYFKSILGTSSPEYRAVTGIAFKNIAI